MLAMPNPTTSPLTSPTAPANVSWLGQPYACPGLTIALIANQNSPHADQNETSVSFAPNSTMSA